MADRKNLAFVNIFSTIYLTNISVRVLNWLTRLLNLSNILSKFCICKYFQHMTITGSIYAVLIIAVERERAILHPLKVEKRN